MNTPVYASDDQVAAILELLILEQAMPREERCTAKFARRLAQACLAAPVMAQEKPS